mgnify:CR=1 FL=1
MSASGVKRQRTAALERLGRPKRRAANSSDQLQTTAVLTDEEPIRHLEADLARFAEMLEKFRRTVVVPDRRLAHLPGETPKTFRNVSPIRLVPVSIMRAIGISEARVAALKQSSRLFLWTLPSGHNDSAAALTSEVDDYVSK